MDVLLREGPTPSKDLKRLAGFGGDGLKDFDTVIIKQALKEKAGKKNFKFAPHFPAILGISAR